MSVHSLKSIAARVKAFVELPMRMCGCVDAEALDARLAKIRIYRTAEEHVRTALNLQIAVDAGADANSLSPTTERQLGTTLAVPTFTHATAHSPMCIPTQRMRGKFRREAY